MNQRIFHSLQIPSWDQTPFFQFFPVQSPVFFFILTKAKLIACEMFLRLYWLSKKRTKGWKQWVREKRKFILLFSAIVHSFNESSQSSLLYTTQWNGSMNVEIYDENKISNFHVSHSLSLCYPFISLWLYLLPFHFSSRPCIKYRKLLKST